MTASAHLCLALLLAAAAATGSAQAGSANSWDLLSIQQPPEVGGGQRERETSYQQPGASLDTSTLYTTSSMANRRRLGQIFNGPFPSFGLQQREPGDLFECLEPNRHLFDQFVAAYNRTFDDHMDKLARMSQFLTHQRRTILLNRMVQNEILNQSNYQLRPSAIANYYFITPTGAQNAPLWYSDVTDCELGLIKYFVFELIYLIESNDLASAYRVALEQQAHLPLLTAEGWEQLANLLLVRLFDRFQGDQQMEQLFRWPQYLKRLAAFAYNRRQTAMPDFKSKLPLISYAYPSYFKDLKYNLAAANRTSDNLRLNEEHERFNELHKRRMTRVERNKRLAIFRQRWTLLRELNSHLDQTQTNIQPEWLRIKEPPYAYQHESEKLRTDQEHDGFSALEEPQQPSNRLKLTQFSDLTDAEFVAFITQDISLLDNGKEFARFMEINLPPRHLDERYRWELAEELELRRLIGLIDHSQKSFQNPNELRPSLKMARRVVDELIGEVGLPFGPVSLPVDENEQIQVFTKVAETFKKPYAMPNASPELLEEKAKRYQEFSVNYGRFKAWFVREGWLDMDEQRLISMLRLADMSWLEIKLSLFKLCCLTGDNLAELSTRNATIHYLASNHFLCQPLSRSGQLETLELGQTVSKADEERRELTLLELYFYYSVHFNKHHLHMDSFYKSQAIFGHNLDQIRRHSCTRALTLYQSLLLKRPDSMNSIDVIDSRRQYTDDLNLDRFRYFQVPNLNASPGSQQHQHQNHLELDPQNQFISNLQDDYSAVAINPPANSGETPSRAGISYRRHSSFFSTLADQRAPLAVKSNSSSSPGSYLQTLINSNVNLNQQGQKYRLNHAQRIYDMVMQRYRLCVLTTDRHREPQLGQKQQCQSAGPLAEQANTWLMENQLSSSQSLKLRQEDKCAFYFHGLEPWDAGLIKQNDLSPQLIQAAKC